MMDPFQSSYGSVLSAFLVLPTMMGDMLGLACTLFSLGETGVKPPERNTQRHHFHTPAF